MEDSFSDNDGSCHNDHSFEALFPPIDAELLIYDPASIENIILSIADRFNFRVVNGQTARAVVLGVGLAMAGTLIGRHFGGKIGAMVGATTAGTCGVGLVVLSMREVWPDVKDRLSQVYEVVYDFVSNLELDNYSAIAQFLCENTSFETNLAEIIINIMRTQLGQQVLSSLTM